MFNRLKSLFAGTQLAPLAPPKVKKGQIGFPSFLKTTKPAETKLPEADRRLATTDTLTYQNGANTKTVIRDFVAASPDLSAAVWSYLRVGIPSRYVATAMNAADGTFNVDATKLLQQIIARMDTLTSYDDGFSSIMSLKSVSEALAREMIMYGAMSGELVLDKSLQPRCIQPISVTTVKFYPDLKGSARGVRPVQIVAGEEINLDTPCFQYVSLDQDLLDPYSWSPIESAIKAVIFKEDFARDIHRIIKKVIHPRQKISIDEEKFRKWGLSAEAQNDPAQAAIEMNSVIAEIESKINGLAPEDALVFLDSIGFEVENPSNAGLATEYKTLQDIGNSRLSTGAKVMGTVLGFQSGSSNIASAETMLFMKSADGAVRTKLNQFYSRAFTLALRIMGQDVYVNFEYEPIDLRPDNELLAFKQTKQMMVLEQLSLGLITDEEASLSLTGKLPPAGFKPLSGTMFQQKAGAAADPADSGGNYGGSSNDGSAMNKNLKSDQPATGRGQNKKAEDDAPEVEAAQAPTFVTPNITMNIDNTQTSASIMKMRRDDDGNLVIERMVANGG
jgi:hypothetical protein